MPLNLNSNYCRAWFWDVFSFVGGTFFLIFYLHRLFGVLFQYCIAGMKEHQYLCIKIYLSTLFTRKGRNGCKRETETVRLMEDYYHWQHNFLTHVVILYSESHLVLLRRSWPETLLNERPLAPGVSAQGVFYSHCPLLLAGRLSYGGWNCMLLTANL